VPPSGPFLVEIAGSPISASAASLLTHGQVDLSLHVPGSFVLRFRDPQHQVLAHLKAEIGAQVTLSAAALGANAHERLLTAEITALEIEHDASGTFTIIRGYDVAHRLHRGRRTAAYAQATASDVARKVASRAGLAVGTIDSTSTVYEHLCQGGETDREFLADLAREVGYEMVVEDGKFSFRKPVPAADAPGGGGSSANQLVLRLGIELQRFRCGVTSAEQVKEVEVRGWDVAQKKALVGTAPAKTVNAQLAAVDPAKLAKAFGNPVYVSTDIPYGTQAEVDTAAKAVAEEIGAAFVRFEGDAVGNPKLRAGTAISVTGMGKPFDGKYVVTTARHRYDQGRGYATAFTVTGRQERGMLGLTGGGRPGRGAPGVVVATVSDVKDPLESGRVKLKFPWLSEEYVSDWARTVQLGAGKDRGATIVPEVNDEVLVAFERGDMRRPYVIGSLYNGMDKPKPGPVPLVDSGSGAVNRRSMVSRRGHRIDLLDQDGKKEGIVVRSGDDKVRIEMDSTGMKITVHSDGTVLVEGPKGVVVDAGTGKLELKGQSIELTAKAGVKVDGGTGPVNVATNAALQMKGMTAKLEGVGVTEIKAALVKIN
jgi:uncharacterized protein involved in type VI secretion and phage assembly